MYTNDKNAVIQRCAVTNTLTLCIPTHFSISRHVWKSQKCLVLKSDLNNQKLLKHKKKNA